MKYLQNYAVHLQVVWSDCDEWETSVKWYAFLDLLLTRQDSTLQVAYLQTAYVSCVMMSKRSAFYTISYSFFHMHT